MTSHSHINTARMPDACQHGDGSQQGETPATTLPAPHLPSPQRPTAVPVCLRAHAGGCQGGVGGSFFTGRF